MLNGGVHCCTPTTRAIGMGFISLARRMAISPVTKLRLFPWNLQSVVLNKEGFLFRC